MTDTLFAPGGTLWFARHELLLSKRDFMAMMTAGRSDRERRVVLFALGATLVLYRGTVMRQRTAPVMPPI